MRFRPQRKPAFRSVTRTISGDCGLAAWPFCGRHSVFSSSLFALVSGLEWGRSVQCYRAPIPNLHTSCIEFVILGTFAKSLPIVSYPSNASLLPRRLMPVVAAFYNPLNSVVDKVMDHVDHIFAAIRGGALPSASFPHPIVDSPSLSYLQGIDGPSATSTTKVAEEIMNTKMSVLVSPALSQKLTVSNTQRVHYGDINTKDSSAPPRPLRVLGPLFFLLRDQLSKSRWYSIDVPRSLLCPQITQTLTNFSCRRRCRYVSRSR